MKCLLTVLVNSLCHQVLMHGEFFMKRGDQMIKCTYSIQMTESSFLVQEEELTKATSLTKI